MSQENLAVVEGCFAAFAARDVERFLDFIHPDVEWQPANVAWTLPEWGPVRYRGHDGVREWFAVVHALEEYRVERRGVRSEAKKVIVEARVTLRSGEGFPVQADVVYEFVVAGGKVTSLTTSFPEPSHA